MLYSLLESHYVQAKGTIWLERTESHTQTSTDLLYLLHYCQSWEKSKTSFQMTQTNSDQNPLQKSCTYLKKKNDFWGYQFHSNIIHSLSSHASPVCLMTCGSHGKNTKMNKTRVWPWQLTVQSVVFIQRFPVLGKR